MNFSTRIWLRRVAVGLSALVCVAGLLSFIAYCLLVWGMSRRGVDPPSCRLLRAIWEEDDAQAMEYIRAGYGMVPCRGELPIHAAARHGRVAILEELLRRGASPSARDVNGYTPLMCGYRDDRVLSILIEAGADINSGASEGGTTALHMAASSHDLDAVKRLIARGAQVDVKTTSGVVGKTPLHHAIMASNHANSSHDAAVAVLEELIRAGADPTYADIVEIPAWLLERMPELKRPPGR